MIWSFITAAFAGDAGLQYGVLPRGLDFVRSELEGRVLEINEREVAAPFACYDAVGIRDFNLQVPIDTVNFELQDQAMYVEIEFGHIIGTDMEAFAEDTEWFDKCIEFDTDIDEVSLENGFLTGTVTMDVENGKAVMSFLGPPQLSGDLETDIDNISDDLLMFLFEDLILDKVAESLDTVVPPMLEKFTEGALEVGYYENFRVALDLQQVIGVNNALTLRTDALVNWEGGSTCNPPNKPRRTGLRNPDLDVTRTTNSDFAVGLTEEWVDGFVYDSWQKGYFCFDEQDLGDMVAGLSGVLDKGVLGMDVQLMNAPEISIESNGSIVDLRGIDIVVTADVNGSEQPLIETTVNVKGLIELQLDQEITAFRLALHELDLEVVDLKAEAILTGDADNAINFIENYVAGLIERKLTGIPVFSSIVYMDGYVIRLDNIVRDNGGLVLYNTMFNTDNPEVDLNPPDTTISDVATNGSQILVSWKGSDDRDGNLVASVRVDGGSWSMWSANSALSVYDLSPGDHLIEVKTRDVWLNEDPTPATTTTESFEAIDDGDEQQMLGLSESSCGCASTSGPGGLFAGLLTMLAVFGRRRDPTHG